MGSGAATSDPAKNGGRPAIRSRRIEMDFQDIVRAAKAQGFVIEPTKKQHVRFRAADGRSVITGSTPSDKRALQNLISDLRKYTGFVFDKHAGSKGKKGE